MSVLTPISFQLLAMIWAICSVWLDPAILDEKKVDFELLFRTNREATTKALGKAMRHEPDIDWLLKNHKALVDAALDGDQPLGDRHRGAHHRGAGGPDAGGGTGRGWRRCSRS